MCFIGRLFNDCSSHAYLAHLSVFHRSLFLIIIIFYAVPHLGRHSHNQSISSVIHIPESNLKVSFVIAKCENAGFMFMFRRKRTCLTKRLWKARIRKEHDIRSKEEAVIEVETRKYVSYSIFSSEGIIRNSVLKRLKDNQLEMLVEAIESGGAGTSTCVLVPNDMEHEAHLLCCQVWRWPDLRSSVELRRTPACSSVNDPVYICCNPYHWSRLCNQESPPPPYSCFEKINSDDCAPSEKNEIKSGLVYHRPYHHLHHFHYHYRHQFRHCSNPYYQDVFRGSQSTNGESDLKENEWCKLAYWELSQRVGRLYPVQNTSVNIFWADVPANGLSLEMLTNHNFSPSEVVHKNRSKIGLGITLSLENDGIWIYNRSKWPVFVNSPSLDQPGRTNLLVYRVPAGHCFRIFHIGMRSPSASYWNGSPLGPVDLNSVRISFAKGWGPNYHRQEITACPTWLEVLLSPCR